MSFKCLVKVKVGQSCPILWEPMDCSPWNSPGQNTGVGSLSLLQGIFPTQGSNPCLLHCRRILYQLSHKFSSVQLLSCVQLFITPCTAAHQASLYFTISWSLLKVMFIESVMSSNDTILCHAPFLLPLLFPSVRVFFNESALISGGQGFGASASASVLPMNIQG